MQGVYDTWFYEDIAGIRPDASGPGFKVTRFEPTMTAYLPWAKATLETPYGEVKSDWKQEGGKMDWKIEIPANASGLVALPDGKTVTVNGQPLDKNRYPAAGQGTENPLYRFPSGHYAIVIE